MAMYPPLKDWFAQMFAWDTARKQDIVRGAMAAGLGLKPEEYVRPFPGSTTTVINGTTPPTSGGDGGGGLKTVLTALGAGGLAGVLGLVGGYVLQHQPAPAPATVPAPVVQPGEPPAGVEWRIRWKRDENGNWQELPPEVKPVPKPQ